MSVFIKLELIQTPDGEAWIPYVNFHGDEESGTRHGSALSALEDALEILDACVIDAMQPEIDRVCFKPEPSKLLQEYPGEWVP